MPLLRCLNVKLDHYEGDYTCLKVLADIPRQALNALKADETARLRFRCPRSRCGWVAVGYEGGKLTFWGDAEAGDFNDMLRFEQTYITQEVG